MPINDYPAWICADCGKKHGRRPEGNRYATWHMGTCGICGEAVAVTEPRDFMHLKDGLDSYDQ